MVLQRKDYTNEFFILALQSNAYDIAFYLYKKYENEIA